MTSAADISRRTAALNYLLGRINYERVSVVPYGERQLKLDRMRTLLNRLGNPDAGLPIIHVAGTKGKGSTSALIAAGLHAAGYEVGVFSSPHLENIEERFSINGRPCTALELVNLVDRIRPVVQQLDEEARAAGDESQQPTFFELTTAMAFMHFAQRKVDAVVLEVGLGGRLDSTNVCQPAVTVITSITLDHTRQLGDTTAQIAAEKGGIIKPGVPLVLGPMDEQARAILVAMAKHHGARVIEAPHEFDFSYLAPHELDDHADSGLISFTSRIGGRAFKLGDAPLRMLGRHQAANAALALATLLELRRQGWLISTHAMRTGLAVASLPGRIEVVGRRPTVVLDVSHNVASVAALVDCLRESFSARRRILIFAASRDKDIPGMLSVLLPHFDRIVLTEYQDNARATPVDQLRIWAREQFERLGRPSAGESLVIASSPGEAWRQAGEMAAHEDLICITGSFFIAAELRPLATAAGSSANAPA